MDPDEEIRQAAKLMVLKLEKLDTGAIRTKVRKYLILFMILELRVSVHTLQQLLGQFDEILLIDNEFNEDFPNITKYIENGRLHRIGGPAKISISEGLGGSRVDEDYYYFGLKHRDGDEPAVIKRWEGGERLEWWKRGVKWRSGGQPVIVD